MMDILNNGESKVMVFDMTHGGMEYVRFSNIINGEIYGWVVPTPKIGDEMLIPIDGGIGVFKFKEIDQCSEMFFGKCSLTKII